MLREGRTKTLLVNEIQSWFRFIIRAGFPAFIGRLVRLLQLFSQLLNRWFIREQAMQLFNQRLGFGFFTSLQ